MLLRGKKIQKVLLQPFRYGICTFLLCVVCAHPVSDSNAKFSFVALVSVLTDYVRLLVSYKL